MNGNKHDGCYKVMKENSTSIMVPITNESDNKAFINPIQEFNRDLSIAAIRSWYHIVENEKKNSNNRKNKQKNNQDNQDNSYVYKFSILEALSATGLRAIRYAKEIPNLKYVTANDFSPSAAEAIRRNVEHNDVNDKVKVSEGDACALMYQHRTSNRFDVVDLDPYGTASPFIDGAVQCVSSGGLLCVTCTDTAVMAGTNYPEKCYANYGGTPVRAEYSHEAALRLVLHTISQSASRYGRYVEPLLCLSIDFYVRLFVRIHDGASEVKKAFSKSGPVHVCSFCQQSQIQPLGRVIEKRNEKGNISQRFQANQTIESGGNCSECGSKYHINGPMWIDNIHNKEFTKVLKQHIENNMDNYNTSTRMKGMITVADEELENVPFYFTCDKISSQMRLNCPPLMVVASGILNAGYNASRSHALAGSIKTNAPRRVIYDIYRKWMQSHPVNIKNVKEHSPTNALISKNAEFDANLNINQDALKIFDNKDKLVRYQENPLPNWGPLARPSSGTPNNNIPQDGQNDDGHKDKKLKIDN